MAADLRDGQEHVAADLQDAKSSTCFHLSGCLAELGFQVLLVDADPQGSLSQAFLGSAEIDGGRLGANRQVGPDFGSG